MRVQLADETFEMSCDTIDVTSLHRPDPRWRFVDANGHEHRWFDGVTPATAYSPTAKFSTPTLRSIFDYWEYFDDGERIAVSHYECADPACADLGAHITPGYTADSTTQLIAGLRHYRINGVSVPEDEFKRRGEAAQKKAHGQ